MRTIGAAGADRRNERGILLIECLVYVGTLSIVVGVALSVFYQVLMSSRHLQRNTEDIARTLRAGERWRADVRAATGRLRLDTDAAGATLRIPQRDGQITYRFVTNAVWRIVEARNRTDLVVPAAKVCRFERDQRDPVVAWRWELELPVRLKAARVDPVFSFTAVPPAESAP